MTVGEGAQHREIVHHPRARFGVHGPQPLRARGRHGRVDRIDIEALAPRYAHGAMRKPQSLGMIDEPLAEFAVAHHHPGGVELRELDSHHVVRERPRPLQQGDVPCARERPEARLHLLVALPERRRPMRYRETGHRGLHGGERFHGAAKESPTRRSWRRSTAQPVRV